MTESSPNHWILYQPILWIQLPPSVSGRFKRLACRLRAAAQARGRAQDCSTHCRSGFLQLDIQTTQFAPKDFRIWVFPPKIGGFLPPKWMVNIMQNPFWNGWFGDTIIFGNTHIENKYVWPLWIYFIMEWNLYIDNFITPMSDNHGNYSIVYCKNVWNCSWYIACKFPCES